MLLDAKPATWNGERLTTISGINPAVFTLYTDATCRAIDYVAQRAHYRRLLQHPINSIDHRLSRGRDPAFDPRGTLRADQDCKGRSAGPRTDHRRHSLRLDSRVHSPRQRSPRGRRRRRALHLTECSRLAQRARHLAAIITARSKMRSACRSFCSARPRTATVISTCSRPTWHGRW